MPPAATTVRGRFADSSTRYSPTPTLSACRSSQACSSLTGISLRRPTRTRRTSDSICARQVSHDTPSASHACSTLRARAGALRFRAARVTAVCGDIGAIAVIDPDPLGPAMQLREAQTPSREERRADRRRRSLERPCEHAGFARCDRASLWSALLPSPALCNAGPSSPDRAARSPLADARGWRGPAHSTKDRLDARPCGHCAIAVSEDAPIEAGDHGPQEGLEMPEVSRFGSTSPAPLRIYRQEMLLALFDFSP
jgi:hypothetical protein